MARRYDLVVIGAGSAAMNAATRVRAAGWKVAVIDFRPFGGTCALRGCDPKKMLIGGTSAVEHVRRMQANGVAGNVRIDWPGLMAFKKAFSDPVPRNQERSYRVRASPSSMERPGSPQRTRSTWTAQALKQGTYCSHAGPSP